MHALLAAAASGFMAAPLVVPRYQATVATSACMSVEAASAFDRAYATFG